MANTLTARRPDFTRRRKRNRLSLALTGSYVQAGATTGEILDLTNIQNPSNYSNTSFGEIPKIDDFEITKMPAGYNCEIVALSPAVPTLSNSFALKIWASPGTEFTAGAYNAALLAATLYMEVNTSTWGQS